MFDGFTLETIKTAEGDIRVRHGGKGPPLLLLHGHPQSHVMWHIVGPRLAKDFTVVAPDLRGYGDSFKPETKPDHEPHSKRAMARDQIAVMKHLGFDRFAVAGHDRGGRVAYRLALDHPQAVTKLAVLDILPTWEHFSRTDMAFAMGYFHWFFLAQPYPLPETLIEANPEAYYFRPGRDVFTAEARAEYLRNVKDKATIHAMCEDYRAGATYDFKADEADRYAGRKIACPMLALWGSRGIIAKLYDALAVWRDWASEVEGHAIESAHFLAEEAPDPTYEALKDFFLRK